MTTRVSFQSTDEMKKGKRVIHSVIPSPEENESNCYLQLRLLLNALSIGLKNKFKKKNNELRKAFFAFEFV